MNLSIINDTLLTECQIYLTDHEKPHILSAPSSNNEIFRLTIDEGKEDDILNMVALSKNPHLFP